MRSPRRFDRECQLLSVRFCAKTVEGKRNDSGNDRNVSYSRVDGMHVVCFPGLFSFVIEVVFTIFKTLKRLGNLSNTKEARSASMII